MVPPHPADPVRGQTRSLAEVDMRHICAICCHLVGASSVGEVR